MIYLDNAATTFPKPENVWLAADRCARRYGGNPGRGSHRLSREAAQAVYDCREEIAALFGGQPENVVFTMNATYALNLAIRALAKPEGRILISGIEHNAVWRPVAALGENRYEVFDATGGCEAVLKAAERALAQRRISLVVCTHLSNLCGLTLPVAGIGALCRKYGARFIIDASQSAGRLPLSLEDSGADAICAPGHKGLYGLQGSGFALFSERCAADAGSLRVFLSGGNGVNSREAAMPPFLPERFEAGTLPAPALAALAEGIRTVRRIGPEAIGAYEDDLGDRLRTRLSGIGGVTLYAPETGGGTVLFNLAGLASETVGEALDRTGICVRCGFHCCPLGHKTLGTGEGGAVRASVSLFTGKRDVDALAEEIGKLLRNR